MALLNGLYLFVQEENISESVDSTSHPVETGIDITDTIRVEPLEISLSGYIVDTGSAKARDIRADVQKLKNKGSLITYNGRFTADNMQIQSFDTGHTSDVWGGMSFSMSLKEVRTAKSAYNAPSSTGASSNGTANTTQEIKVGSIVVFNGGNVYVSSDATKAAAKRNKSTCKVTIISTASYSIHQYHLISTDGGMVYGWVDKSNIEGTSGTSTAATTNGGTQQVNATSGTAVYHTVKSGDTIWSLVNTNYRSLGKTCQWVIDNNPNAFSVKGDATTLKVGAKLLMGYKS